MTKTLLVLAVLVLSSPSAEAVFIGPFPGLDELIEEADAIVILRVDRNVTIAMRTPYSTHDCYLLKTLKGDLKPRANVRLQLMSPRSPAPLNSGYSTHLVFLTKKRSENEPTEYRTIEIHGANVRLSPTGHESMPVGKNAREQIVSLLNETVTYNKKQHEKERAFLKKQHEKERAFLNLMIQGDAQTSETFKQAQKSY